MATCMEEREARLAAKRDLRMAAIQALEAHSHFRGRTRHIRIENHAGHVVLHGVVPSFYLKQVLQTIIRGVEGVRRIDNQVDVRSPQLMMKSVA